MVTGNQKSITDTHTQKKTKKKFKHSTKDSHHITGEESKRKMKELKRVYKNNQKTIKWQ